MPETKTALVSEDGVHTLDKQQLTAPDKDAKPIVLPLTDYKFNGGYGSKVLLLVAGTDAAKKNLLKASLQHVVDRTKLVPQHIVDRNELVAEGHHADTTENQPYDEGGIKCLTERLRAMISYAKENESSFGERGIGTVIVGAIENYIRDTAVDFGAVAFYNVETGMLVQAITQGVPVQRRYLLEAHMEVW
jgi:hypothetical protein